MARQTVVLEHRRRQHASRICDDQLRRTAVSLRLLVAVAACGPVAACELARHSHPCLPGTQQGALLLCVELHLRLCPLSVRSGACVMIIPSGCQFILFCVLQP